MLSACYLLIMPCYCYLHAFNPLLSEGHSMHSLLPGHASHMITPPPQLSACYSVQRRLCYLQRHATHMLSAHYWIICKLFKPIFSTIHATCNRHVTCWWCNAHVVHTTCVTHMLSAGHSMYLSACPFITHVMWWLLKPLLSSGHATHLLSASLATHMLFAGYSTHKQYNIQVMSYRTRYLHL